MSAESDKAYQDAIKALARLGPLRELADELRTYPLRLLRLICDEHRARGAPVPDHVLKLAPYLGETSLRALVDGGFVQREADAQYAIHAYYPTKEGLALVQSVDGAAGSKPAPKRRPKA